MSNTEENLKKALAGESQANRKYIAFASKAEKEGFPQVSKLFRAASESEAIHALNIIRIMRGVKSTADNLVSSLEGETFEYTKMYPQFIEEAEKEGRKDAIKIFSDASKTEEYHARYYKEAIEQITQKKDIIQKDYYICSVCGYTSENEALDVCPICNSKHSFKKVL